MIEIKDKKSRLWLKKLMNVSIENSNLLDFMVDCIIRNRAILVYSDRRTMQLITENHSDCLLFLDELLNFVSLIESLRRNDLIFIHSNPDILIPIPVKTESALIINALNGIPDLERRMQEDMTQFNIVWHNTIFSYIQEYTSSFIYVRHELRDYVNNDFISLENRRFRQTLFWTRCAAIVSLIGLLAALILPFISKTTINQKQFDTLNKSIQKKEMLYLPNDVIQTNDSTFNRYKPYISDSFQNFFYVVW